jgi:hypothetical protein
MITCKACLATINIDPGIDPHSVDWCNCGTVEHGGIVLPAESCEAAHHPGQPCWHPPDQPDRPDGCTVRQPVIHHVNANVIFGG